jgi:UDP-N-acetylglucosamine 2-epimerase (non-hydrolysing)
MATARVTANNKEESPSPRTPMVLCVVGTRPEAIKMAPVIQALKMRPGLEIRVLATAQHREMLDVTLAQFGIAPDIDLDSMRPDQSLADLTGRLLTGVGKVLAQEQPQFVVAQGDTTTVFAAALASFYQRIPFGHVEAGLRTSDFSNPFPEEMNRSFAGRLATLHFAPTAGARANLLREGIPDDLVHVTGNTVIDAVRWMTKNNPSHGLPIDDRKRTILLTCHRRENFGAPLGRILSAVKRLAKLYPDVQIVYPVHPNPNVANPVREVLSGIPNIFLTAPLGYAKLVALIKACYFVMTDSGGLQEEAPALGKPVLVLRNETERPEAVQAGVAMLVGSDSDSIVTNAVQLLNDTVAYEAMARCVLPYGDGLAATRIADIVERRFIA